jgi:peptidoglycan/LPS O-acetylase OafA/YrhL
MRYWLSRASLALLVVAFALAWPAYTAMRGTGTSMPRVRIYLQLAGAAFCVLLGMMGAAYRHRGD